MDEVFGHLCVEYGRGLDGSKQLGKLAEDHDQVVVGARRADKFTKYVYANRLKQSVSWEQRQLSDIYLQLNAVPSAIKNIGVPWSNNQP